MDGRSVRCSPSAADYERVTTYVLNDPDKDDLEVVTTVRIITPERREEIDAHLEYIHNSRGYM
jgi:hypothetical protein